MEWGPLIIFFLVYLGMILGSLPGLALDRTGIALLGAIAFIGIQNLSLFQVCGYLDVSTLTMLFSFMIISSQFYYSGIYTYLIDRIEKWRLSPERLLLVIIFISGLLSALLLNDIVCLALTPLIIRGCVHKKLNPLPFLLGLCCASNIGSAITLVGNPQNILIGQVFAIPFAEYMKFSLIPCLLSLFISWVVIKYQTKNNWIQEQKERKFEIIPFNFWQSSKGVLLILILFIIFFFSDLPRDQTSLIAAGFLLLSRRMASHTILSFIDWQLLVLFSGLFIINKGFLSTGLLDALPNFLANYQIDLKSPFWIFLISALLSNIVSNVPAVMLLLPFIGNNFNGSLLALSSTLAGNFFIVGSIANLIVISQAASFGVKISWRRHFWIGAPVTLISFGLTAAWLYFLSE